MSKVLTDKEALEIIRLAVIDEEIDCADSYQYFLEDLGKLIAKHFGGQFTSASTPLMDEGNDAETRHCLLFAYDEFVPPDGGVYSLFDMDKSVEEWKNER